MLKFIKDPIIPGLDFLDKLSLTFTQLTIQVHDKMKAKLIDENIIAVANENAKTVVADLLSATVQSIDPEFTVVVVQ